MRGVNCRHFVVPILSDDETAEAVATVRGLDGLYGRGSPEFRWLLRTPFNLWLAEKLLSGDVDTNALSEVSSEVQLLSLFWRQRVTSGLLSLRRRSVLGGVARTMVEARELSLRLDAIYRRDDDEVWQDLFSAEVLTTVGTAGQRVSFAHNILFDFAVSVLLIEDDPEQVASFLSVEPARPVFLRPSINYYFTRLWFEDRGAFWAVAWLLLTTDAVHLRLFGRLIPMAVVVREARVVDDLAPVFRALERNDRAAPDAVLRLLQARRALHASQTEMWLSAFQRFIGAMDRRFAWDLTVQTYDAVTARATPAVLESAGSIGRAVLASVLALRDEQPWADALGSSWAIRLVAATYCTEAVASQRLLRPILEAIGDKTLSVEYLRHIVSHVSTIWTCDPAFAAEIYERVLSHKETSTEATRMGTPVLPLTSNRRQDFGMCIYELNEHYAEFLAASAVHALSGGIAAVDQFVERDHVQPYINEGYTIADLTHRFRFGDREALYVRDISESWRASSHQDQELQIADRIFRYIERAAEAGDTAAVDQAIGMFVDRARMAFWWAGLLDLAARHADVFAQRLFPLCVAEPVLSGSATIKQVTDFISVAYPIWSREQREAVEHAMFAMRRDGGDKEWAERCRQRLLGLIPTELIATDEARAVRTEMAQAGLQPSNEPLVRFTFSSGTFGEAEWLREQGADLRNPANVRLREVSSPLESFGTSWNNGVPTREAVDAILPAMEESLRLIPEGGADPPVIAMARTRVATAAMLAARTVKPGESGFDLIRVTLLEAARHPLMEGDEPRNDDCDSPAWAPRPETEAAQGLPWIALRQRDDEVLDVIDTLGRSPDAIVRYLTVGALFRISAIAPDRFWSLVDERIAVDRAPIVRLALCESLARVAGRDRQRVADAARRLWALLPRDRPGRSEFRDILLDIVIWLRLEGDDAWAREALDELVRVPLANPWLLQAAVFRLWHKAIPSRLATDRAVVDDVLRLTSEAVSQTCRALAERDRAHDERDAEHLKSLYGVLDESVAHVYFCMSREHSRDGSATADARRDFFALVAPVLDAILDFGLDRGFLLAPTVHHFMELLNEVVIFDARRAVIMASRAARAGEGANYNIDSLAIREVVQLVQRVLADHRSEVQDGEALGALMALLDVFAATGWPEAIQLVWRLDDLFR
jgi:hypothetical protein